MPPVQSARGSPAWAEARRAEGYALAWRSAEIEGFPLAFRLHLGGTALETARPFPAAVASDQILLEAAPWNLHRWRFSAPQGVQVRAPLDQAGIAAASLDGTVSDRADGTIVTASARALSGIGLAEGFAADMLDAQLTLPPHGPGSERDMLFAVSAKLQGAIVPRAPPPFAQRIDEVSLAATMKGAIAAAPLDRALAQWRDGGGTLDIDAARIVSGGTTVALGGTLALDEAMQPEGALTATITGGDRIIDALVAAGAIKERFAGFAKSVLGAISTPGDSGDTLHVPVTVQDQRLYLGPAPIAALPHMTWR